MKSLKKPLVETATFGVHPKLGKLESIHFLTQTGKELLMRDLDIPETEIRHPIGRVSFAHDYFHRKATIDIHIQLVRFVVENDLRLVCFDTYFDFTGNRRVGKDLVAKTAFPLENKELLVPDGVFMLENAWGLELYALEVYLGNDSGRVLRQLFKHATGLKDCKLSIQHNHSKAYRIVSIFEKESCLESVLRQAREEPIFDRTRANFLFKPLSEVLNNEVFTGWKNGAGNRAELF